MWDTGSKTRVKDLRDEVSEFISCIHLSLKSLAGIVGGTEVSNVVLATRENSNTACYLLREMRESGKRSREAWSAGSSSPADLRMANLG